MHKRREYQSFLLRLWRREDDGAYCALLHSVQADERHVFADLEMLIQFLRELAAEAATTAPEDNTTKPS